LYFPLIEKEIEIDFAVFVGCRLHTLLHYEQNMGASQGKSNMEQTEEARRWAENKDNEVATLYGENIKLTNEMRLLQAEVQAMKLTMEQDFRQRQAEQLKTVQAYEESLKRLLEETEAVKQEMMKLKAEEQRKADVARVLASARGNY